LLAAGWRYLSLNRVKDLLRSHFPELPEDRHTQLLFAASAFGGLLHFSRQGERVSYGLE
jgi:hypothetical protein